RLQCPRFALAVRRSLSGDLPDRPLSYASLCLARSRTIRGGCADRERPTQIAVRGLDAFGTGNGQMMPALDLVPVWTTILAIGVFLYVALDGFDLGVGML